MRFLAHISIHDGPLSKEILTPELIREEIGRIRDLLSSGVCHNAWRRLDKIAIILLLQSESEETCRALLANLPFGRAGILDVEAVIPVDLYLNMYG